MNSSDSLTKPAFNHPATAEEFDAAFEKLQSAIYTALKTYSNVHRGSGHFSQVSTALFEEARKTVANYFGIDRKKQTVVFCSHAAASVICAHTKPCSYQFIASKDLGLAIGVTALVMNRKVIRKSIPALSGGGTTRLIATDWILWADAPDRFEAGTPPVINIIAFAKALQLAQKSGKDLFLNAAAKPQNTTSEDILSRYEGQELLEQLRSTLVGKEVQVTTMNGKRPFINLDNSASTPTFEPIWEAYRSALITSKENSQKIIAQTKDTILGFLGADNNNYELLFATNTTEAINIAATNLRLEKSDNTEPVVLSTLLEHSSNDLPWRLIPGFKQLHLPVDDFGFFDLEALQRLLHEYNELKQHGNQRIRMVAVSAASNVLGTCNDMQKVTEMAHRHGAKVLVDAAQLVAHRRVVLDEWKADFLAFSAHKIYAPFGSGALVYKKGNLFFDAERFAQLKASGEENVAGISALQKSLQLLDKIGMDRIEKEERKLTTKLLEGLSAINGVNVYGISDVHSKTFEDKLGVIGFEVKGGSPKGTAKMLALRGGIGMRYGCHCAHIIVKKQLKITPPLEKIQKLILQGFPKLQLQGMVRASLGLENTEEEVDHFLQILKEIAQKSKADTKMSKKEAEEEVRRFVERITRKVFSR